LLVHQLVLGELVHAAAKEGREAKRSDSPGPVQIEANVLNPTDRSTDPMNRRVGNPYIDPQFTHSFSLLTVFLEQFPAENIESVEVMSAVAGE
jgi:hypothetical protein